MKISAFRFIAFVVVVLMSVSCNDRNQEKRIAELEARLKELEGKKANNNTPGVQETPTVAPLGAAMQPATADVKPDGPLPAIQFETLDFDFGTVAEGKVVEHTYSFKNTGAAPLIIQSAQPSCGCTVPEWSKDPIPVGGTGFVKAKFDTNGKPNIQNKTITVTANTWPKQTVLRFKAMVTPKGSSEGPVKK